MSHHKLGDRHVGHVAVAGLALDLRPDMGSMAELDVGLWLKSVDPHPRDLTPFLGILLNLLYLWLVGGYEPMAQHALANGWHSRRRARVYRDVTIDAFQAFRYVFVVRKLDRLLAPDRYSH